MSKKAPKPIIYAYGFDKCRFMLPSSPHETNEFVVKFFAYESDCSFEEADGLIIPSGIFEEIYWENDYLGGREQKIRFDKAVLAAREKQLYNAFKSGVWTLFMLKTFDAQNLAHAKTNNVRILRTITLFEMMLALENATDRKGVFFVACQDAAPLVKVS